MINDMFEDIRRALKEAELPFVLVGGVVFGSRVSGEATHSSDLDMLVVAEGIPARLHRRGQEIRAIKRSLPPLPIDLLLQTRQEVISNFNNHNPLFLDIAEEGQIIFDTQNFLEDLVVATRAYIKQRGIQRTQGGWVFPIRAGALSFLSKVSNRDFSLAMLEEGQRDFIIAKRLSSDEFFDKAVYHFQQAVEKSVKSVLIAVGVFEKTHFVGEILREHINKGTIPEKWKAEVLEIAEISSGIEPDVSLSRYPGIIEDNLWLPSKEYEKEDAVAAENKAGKAVSMAKRFTDDWFTQE